MKIMIVDDHTDMRRMLKSIVSLASNDTSDAVEVIECDNGEEAIEQYSLQRPDCVLMDIQLKKMNGFDASEKIFKYDPKASIIFITSHNVSAFRMKAYALRAKGFVTKDNLAELNPLLHQITSRGGQS